MSYKKSQITVGEVFSKPQLGYVRLSNKIAFVHVYTGLATLRPYVGYDYVVTCSMTACGKAQQTAISINMIDIDPKSCSIRGLHRDPQRKILICSDCCKKHDVNDLVKDMVSEYEERKKAQLRESIYSSLKVDEEKQQRDTWDALGKSISRSIAEELADAIRSGEQLCLSGEQILSEVCGLNINGERFAAEVMVVLSNGGSNA